MAYDLGSAHGKIELEYTGHDSVDRAQHDMDNVGKSSKKADNDLKKLTKTFRSLGKAALTFGKFSAIGVGLIQAGAAAGNLAVQLLGVVPQLTSILSLSAAIPGALVGIAATAGTLKAVFAGVGDTIKAAFETDPAKFDKALKELAPSAQEFAKAIRSAAPELKKFQQGLQDSFFSASSLATAVPKATSVLAELKPSLNGLASQFGEITRQITNFVLSADSVDFIRASVDHFRAAVEKATPAIFPMLNGLRSVGTVGLPLLDKLGVAAGDLGEKFGNWLSAVAGDGRLQTWIDTALATLKTLGTIAQNVGGILQSVFSAAAATGGGLLNSLAGITGAFNDFLKSASGKSAITSLFSSLATVAGQLTPVITTLVGALAGALGPAIKSLAEGVGPVLLQVVEALTPAFAPLANAISALLQAIAPILPPLAALISLLAEELGTVVQTLAAELGPLISVLGEGLTGALQALLPGIQSFAQILPDAAKLGQGLASAFAPLVPLFVEFGQTLGDAIQANMPAFLDAAQQLVPAITELAQALAVALASGLQRIIPMIPAIVGAFVTFVDIMAKVAPVVIGTITFFVQLGTALGNLVAAIPGFVSAVVNGIGGAIKTAYDAVVSAGGAIISWFGSLPGKAVDALKPLPGTLVSAISNAVKAMAFTFGQEIGLVLSLIINLPGQIGSALASLPGLLSSLAVSAWNAAKAAFSSGISAVVSFARTFPGKARSAIASLGGQLASVAASAWAAVRNAFTSGISTVVSVARSLPGKVKSAVGNLGSLLYSAGRDVVIGLANGIKSAVGAAVSAAVSVGKQVIDGVKSTLHISSPSRIMIQLGRFINQGLIDGLTGTAKQVKSAANRVANAVKDAYSDRLIKASQKNSVLSALSKGTAQLTALVNKSAAVSARLKTAQANLAAVQKSYNDAQAKASQAVRDSFSIVQPGKKAVNLESVKNQFAKAVAQAKQFAADIQALAKKGLNRDLIAQIANAGVADGGVMAHALATASAEDIKTFNNLQGQLSTAANSVGKATADALYGAGVKAAQGLVNGLRSQQKAIDKEMERIAKKLANAIKKALKIKSPSRVMFQLGLFIAQGLKNGIQAGLKAVAAMGKTLATAAINPTIALPAIASGTMNTVARNTPKFTADASHNNTNFGPYNLVVDDQILTSIMVNAITGNPTVVSKSSNEGTRVTSWAGSGR